MPIPWNIIIGAALSVGGAIINRLTSKEPTTPEQTLDRATKTITASAEPVRQVIGNARVSGQLCRYATYVDFRRARERYLDEDREEGTEHLLMYRYIHMLLVLSEGQVRHINNRIWVNGRPVVLAKTDKPGQYLPVRRMTGLSGWESPSDPKAYPFFFPSYGYAGGREPNRGTVLTPTGPRDAPNRYATHETMCSFYFAYPDGRSANDPLIKRARQVFDTSAYEGTAEEKVLIKQDAENILGSGLALCLASFKISKDVNGRIGPWLTMPNLEFEVKTRLPNHNPARIAKQYLTEYLNVPESDIDDEDGKALTIPEQLFPLNNLTKGSPEANRVVTRTLGKDLEDVTDAEYDRILASYNKLYPTHLQTLDRQYRYHADGVISTSDEPQKVLDGLGEVMAGRVFRYGGKWYIRPGYERPAKGVITSEHVLNNQLSIQLEPAFDQRPNAVTARIRQDYRRNYLKTSIPEVEFDDLIARDGKIPRDFGVLSYINDEILARKLMTIAVNKASRGLATVTLTCGPGEGFWIFQLKPTDVVLLNIEEEGFRTFQNERARFLVESVDPRHDGSVALVLKEEHGDTYIERAGNIVARDDTPPRFGYIIDDPQSPDIKCSAPDWDFYIGAEHFPGFARSVKVAVTDNVGVPSFALTSNGGLPQLRIDPVTGWLTIVGSLTHSAENPERTGDSINYTVQVTDSKTEKTSSCTGTINFTSIEVPYITGPSEIEARTGETTTATFDIYYPTDTEFTWSESVFQYGFIINRYLLQLGVRNGLPPTWATITESGQLSLAVPASETERELNIFLQAVRRNIDGELSRGPDGRIETSTAERLFHQVRVKLITATSAGTCNADTLTVKQGDTISTSDIFSLRNLGNNFTIASTFPVSWLSATASAGRITLAGTVPTDQETGDYDYQIRITHGNGVCILSGRVKVISSVLPPPPVNTIECNLPGHLEVGGGGLRTYSIDTTSKLNARVTPFNTREGVTPTAIIGNNPSWLHVERRSGEIYLVTADGVTREPGSYTYRIRFVYAETENTEIVTLDCTGRIIVRGSISTEPLEWTSSDSFTLTQGDPWAGVEGNFGVSATTDSSCGSIVYSVGAIPNIAFGIDSNTGIFTGNVPDDMTVGTHTARAIATDSCGQSINKLVTFNVEEREDDDDEDPPTFTCGRHTVTATPGDTIDETFACIGVGLRYDTHLVTGKPSWIEVTRVPTGIGNFVGGIRVRGTVPSSFTSDATMRVPVYYAFTDLTGYIVVTFDAQAATLRITNSDADFFIRKYYNDTARLTVTAAGGAPGYTFSLVSTTSRRIVLHNRATGEFHINKHAPVTQITESTAVIQVRDAGGLTARKTLTVENLPFEDTTLL